MIFLARVVGVFCLFGGQSVYLMVFSFFDKKREMSILQHYGEFYENTAKNRFYPILSSLDVVC